MKLPKLIDQQFWDWNGASKIPQQAWAGCLAKDHCFHNGKTVINTACGKRISTRWKQCCSCDLVESREEAW